MKSTKFIAYPCAYLLILALIYLYEGTFIPIVDLAWALILQASYFWLKDSPLLDQLASLGTFIKKRPLLLTLILFLALSLYLPYVYLFVACLFLDVDSRANNFPYALLLVFLGGLWHYPFVLALSISLLSFLFALISLQTALINEEERRAFEQINRLRWLNRQLKGRQDQLLRLQDDIENQTIISERRRITKEIHDLLGHQLSASIIQLGALEMIIHDPLITDKIQHINQTLQTSMANVRSIIHAQHAQSIDLDRELQQLIADYPEYHIHYHYQVDSPLDSQVSHHLLAISRECLTNIRKHAQASRIQLFIRELNQQVTYLITDNGQGNPAKQTNPPGIGLINIEERVDQMGGQLYINQQAGFRVFISIPLRKEFETYEDSPR